VLHGVRADLVREAHALDLLLGLDRARGGQHRGRVAGGGPGVEAVEVMGSGGKRSLNRPRLPEGGGDRD